ncbi:AAA family ATPase [Deferribacteraceae bacterium V6Fe1]|jgi:putative ATPase|nr:ATPase central domain protein [Deferribacteraceae bacterium]UOD34059.1 AAA family ATPase [Deferribacteraceae bacterium V6Fe1]
MRLYELIEPQKIEDIVGQGHLLAPNTPLSKIIESGEFESIIFVGPPGTGKTTLAKLIGKKLSLPFHRLHGAATSVNEIKNIAEVSKHYGRPSIIFIDEIHRFNKTQQDLLLKVIDEKHSFVIGASTENPYFSLTPAMRSRSFLFEFKPLNSEAMLILVERACNVLMEKYGVEEISFLEKDKLVQLAGGDGRRLIKFLDTAAQLGKIEDRKLIISLNDIDELVHNLVYSRDEHYDLLSAMIKSIRGSDPDAALVWCFKLVNCGFAVEDIFRRLFVSASEDIGNAYPDAVIFVNSAFNAFLNVGVPEGYIILAHAVTFLASCPKSNKSYLAYKKVKDYLQKNDPYPPINICHNSNGYKYPFDSGEFVKQNYFDGDEKFYIPSEYGFESKIKERLKRLWG